MSDNDQIDERIESLLNTFKASKEALEQETEEQLGLAGIVFAIGGLVIGLILGFLLGWLL